MNDEIRDFHGEYRFLSNFYKTDISYGGVRYSSVEHAYQAQKTESKLIQLEISNILSPGEAKRRGKQIVTRRGWENEKEKIMLDLLRLKFSKYKLGRELLATGSKKLIEGNYWHDNFWGICFCKKCKIVEGDNRLGKFLMQVRDEVRDRI